MRVLFYLRDDWQRLEGGDVVEAGALCAALQDSGHVAQIAGPSGVRSDGWDVVHLFNLDRAPEVASFLDRHGGFPGARVVFQPLARGHSYGHLGAVANLIRSAPSPSPLWLPGKALRLLRERADGLVFHTRAERDCFLRGHPGFAPPSLVAGPALAPQGPRSAAVSELGLRRPYIAVIGRIEPLKRQVWIQDSGVAKVVPIVFVGRTNPKRPFYTSRFHQRLRRCPECRHLGHLAPAVVAAILKDAAAHLLASVEENFGLVTLEALAVGCEAIVSERTFALEAVGDHVHCFRPDAPSSLVEVVSRVLSGERRAVGWTGERYAPWRVAGRLIDFYQDLAPRGAEPASTRGPLEAPGRDSR